MRTILCFGDSNTWGCVPVVDDGVTRRFLPGERWPGVLRDALGPSFWVVEEGLNGRTTAWDDPDEPFRNGLAFLPPALLTHMPLDLVILMLGTNDLKRRFDLSPQQIAEGAGRLVDAVRASGAGPGEAAPAVLLVCPAPLAGRGLRGDEFAGGAEKSVELAAHYRAVATDRDCAFVDAGEHIRSSDVDGIHLDGTAHRELGHAIADRVADFGATRLPADG